MTTTYNPRARHDYSISTFDGQIWATLSCTEGRIKSLVRAYTKSLGKAVRAEVLSW